MSGALERRLKPKEEKKHKKEKKEKADAPMKLSNFFAAGSDSD
mgnify:CR=1 FL=1